MNAQLVGAYAAAVVAVIGAVFSGLALLQASRAKTGVDTVKADVQQVHVLVNSQLTAVVGRVAQLTETLSAAGVEIPPEPPAPAC